jgi:hypothetical protein
VRRSVRLGHILFPGSNRRFDTTNAATFVPHEEVSKAKPTVKLEPNASLNLIRKSKHNALNTISTGKRPTVVFIEHARMSFSFV